MGMGCISHHHWLDSFQQFNTGNCLQRQFSWFPARSSVQKEEVPFSWSETLMAVSSSILLTWFFFFLSWRSWHFVLSFHCSTYHGFYFPGWKLQPGRCCHHLPHTDWKSRSTHTHSAFDPATNISCNPKLEQIGIAVLKKGILAQVKIGDKQFWKRNFMQWMGRNGKAQHALINSPALFFLRDGGRGKWFFEFFPCYQCVLITFPNMFHKMLSIAPQFYPIWFAHSSTPMYTNWKDKTLSSTWTFVLQLGSKVVILLGHAHCVKFFLPDGFF